MTDYERGYAAALAEVRAKVEAVPFDRVLGATVVSRAAVLFLFKDFAPAPSETNEPSKEEAMSSDIQPIDHVAKVRADLPKRVIVDQHGHYWRDFGTHLSMPPVSDENLETTTEGRYLLVDDGIEWLVDRAVRTGIITASRAAELLGVSLRDWRERAIALAAPAPSEPGLDVAYVPTPDDLDDLCAAISACGYASEAVEVVENWTRARWGVESAMTTRFARLRGDR